MTMTNPTDTLAALRARSLAALIVAPSTDRAATRHNEFAVMDVVLPDGTTGKARALDVAGATAPRAEDWLVPVQQGNRSDLWHVSQLSVPAAPRQSPHGAGRWARWNLED